MIDVINRICKLPGLSGFLLPLLFSDLQQAVHDSSVIIVNVSKYSYDALIVLVNQPNPIHIPLSITRKGVRELTSKLHMLTLCAKSMEVTRDLGIFLWKLWDEAIPPIANTLQRVHPIQLYIWWCPTAKFSLLPLHTTGLYRKGQWNLANLFISSYTPTLTVLTHARHHTLMYSAFNGKLFIGIDQIKAKGENELVLVSAKLASITQRINGLIPFTHIEGQKSCITWVAEELRRNEWMHLACYDIPNQNQLFESAFMLHDRTVHD
ncbi:hypothetical protein J3R82DRAFT_9901 [Butyriboletus roseoflavus]|nr:hypothetical protein J3R82DRAFT_9901 [Butyriboletus roseoflavus]